MPSKKIEPTIKSCVEQLYWKYRFLMKGNYQTLNPHCIICGTNLFSITVKCIFMHFIYINIYICSCFILLYFALFYLQHIKNSVKKIESHMKLVLWQKKLLYLRGLNCVNYDHDHWQWAWHTVWLWTLYLKACMNKNCLVALNFCFIHLFHWNTSNHWPSK